MKASYVAGTFAHITSFASSSNTVIEMKKNVAAHTYQSQDLNLGILVVGSKFLITTCTYCLDIHPGTILQRLLKSRWYEEF